MNIFLFFLVKIPKGAVASFYDHHGFNSLHFESDKFGIKIGESIDGCEVIIEDYTVFVKKEDLFLV